VLDWGVWYTPRLGRFTPRKGTQYPLYSRLDGPQGRSGQVRKISPPPGFFCFFLCGLSTLPCYVALLPLLVSLCRTRHTTQTSMPSEGHVPAIPASEWRPVWTGAKNLAPSVIRSPDRPARSESLYRLTYPDSLSGNKAYINCYSTTESYAESPRLTAVNVKYRSETKGCVECRVSHREHKVLQTERGSEALLYLIVKSTVLS
jgi:hypothetical protein